MYVRMYVGMDGCRYGLYGLYGSHGMYGMVWMYSVWPYDISQSNQSLIQTCCQLFSSSFLF